MRWLALASTLPMATAALADVPKVATDIAPVHSLVAMVMGDLGTPELILPVGGDPHYFQLRPSQMRKISDADLVVWVGPALTPWLADVLQGDGVEGRLDLTLLDPDHMPMTIEGTMAVLNIETEVSDQDSDHPTAEAHYDDHSDHDDKHGDEHADGHADEHHDDHADDHGEEHGDAHAGHDHGPIDPHIWLDPLNAVHFLDEISEALSKLDPDNAAIYSENAETAQTRLTELTDRLTQDLRPMHNAALIPYHDAYKYFFIRFGLQVSGALSASDSAAPSAARLASVRDTISTRQRSCLFTEPGANEQLIASVVDGDSDAVISHLDALGTTLDIGADMYGALISDMARAILACRS